MKFFGGGEPSKKKKEEQHETSDDDEDEIPIITDAVVVRVEDGHPPPPSMNPQYAVPTAPPAPGVMTVHQQQQQLVQFYRPIPMYNLGRNPVGLQCPYCQRPTITVVQDLVGMGTVIAVIFLALFFWPLCWIPFCIPSCRRTHHFCGHNECRRKIGETSVCA